MHTVIRHRLFFALGVLALAVSRARAAEPNPWIVLEGREGPGHGKHVVLVSGDEEYRSEEALPQLAKILAARHGFKCTVLFAIEPADGTINPNRRDNIPGLEALQTADLLVAFTRFRELPDDQMREIVNYLTLGKSVIGMRTATHGFAPKPETSFARFGWQSKEWDGGFGRQVLGETWINHHGQHGKQSTRGLIAPRADDHPILRGIREGEIWGPTDVYAVRLPLPADCKPLVLGQVLAGMHEGDPPASGQQNDPMMPVAWVKSYTLSAGRTGRVFTTTMGASQDLSNEGVRRMLVNACYWATGLEGQIPPRSNVDIVGTYHPTPFGFGSFAKGKKPADYAAE
jgi:Trehalose utilisation